MAVISIEIISDVICPWVCSPFLHSIDINKDSALLATVASSEQLHFIKRRIPGAQKMNFKLCGSRTSSTRLHQQRVFSSMVALHYVIYILPLTYNAGTDRMARRMTPAQISAAQTRLIRVGKTVGIEFRFGGSIGSSRLAHRVLHLALERGGSETQCAVAETLFKYQFEMERDVSDVDVVVQAAVESSGLAELDVRAFLAGGGGVEETETEARGASQGQRVQGVPHFVIGGEHHLDGAGEMEEFFQAFVAARAGVGKTAA